jgi:hypothetical protein
LSEHSGDIGMNRREKSDNINGWLGYFSAYGA